MTNTMLISEDVKKLVQSISITIFNSIWIALYFLVFKIQKKKLVLQADDHNSFKASLKRRKMIDVIVLGVYIIGEIIYTVFEILTYY